MPSRDFDGVTLYQYPDEMGDITFNGVTIKDQHPIAVKVWPNGYGWVLLQVDPTTNEEHMWVDGQYQSYFKYGFIEILERSHQTAFMSGAATQDTQTSYMRGR